LIETIKKDNIKERENEIKIKQIDYNPFKNDINLNPKPINLMDFIQKHSK
jgi:uncharacterized protein (DUF1919 family)